MSTNNTQSRDPLSYCKNRIDSLAKELSGASHARKSNLINGTPATRADKLEMQIEACCDAASRAISSCQWTEEPSDCDDVIECASDLLVCASRRAGLLHAAIDFPEITDAPQGNKSSASSRNLRQATAASAAQSVRQVSESSPARSSGKATTADLSPAMTEFRKTFTASTLGNTRASFTAILAMLDRDPALADVAHEMRTACTYITRAETLITTK